MTRDAWSRRQKLAWVLLIAMTVVTFGGPFAIWAVIRGGSQPDWPPDRPVEWATLLGVCTLVVALMVLAIAAAIASQRAEDRTRNETTDRANEAR